MEIIGWVSSRDMRVGNTQGNSSEPLEKTFSLGSFHNKITSHPKILNLNVVYSLWDNCFSYRTTIRAPEGFRSYTSGDPNWTAESLPRLPHSPQPHPWALMSKWKGTHPSVWGARRHLPGFLTRGTLAQPHLTQNIKQMGGKNSSGWSQRRKSFSLSYPLEWLGGLDIPSHQLSTGLLPCPLFSPENQKRILKKWMLFSDSLPGIY